MEGYIVANYKNGLDETGCNKYEYEELFEKYSKQIQDGLISQEGIESILGFFMSMYGVDIEVAQDDIRNIYIHVLCRKYLSEEGYSDIGSIIEITKSVSALKNNITFVNELKNLEKGKPCFYDIVKACKDVYEYLITKIFENDKEVEKKPFEEYEELQPEHLLDAKYYLDHFREWNKGDKEFEKVLDKEIWRYI